MFKRNLIKVYVLLWFITGCKISYKTYNFEDSPIIETPEFEFLNILRFLSVGSSGINPSVK